MLLTDDSHTWTSSDNSFLPVPRDILAQIGNSDKARSAAHVHMH